MILPGIVMDLSMDAYHADRNYLSSSALKVALNDPRLFVKKHINGELIKEKEGTHFAVGSFTHTLILEPEKAGEFVVYPGRRYGREWEAFKSANFGRQILTETEMAEAHRLADLLKADKEIMYLFQGGQSEVAAFGSVNGVAVKARADYLKGNVIIDIKTTSKPIDFENLMWTIKDYGYDLSAAHYRNTFREVTGKDHDFILVLVRKDVPDVAWFEMPPHAGQAKWEKAIKRIYDLKRTGISNKIDLGEWYE
jgi:hypothetical protein